MLDKTKAREIAVDYSKEVQRLINPDKIVFFGSYVNGSPHKDSDIDIAVIVQGLDDEQWYDTRILLQKIRRNKVFLSIEPHLLEESNDLSGFVQHVMNTGEVIFQS
ncbi:MAG: nucleotidyltransferase domain-containing protein [Defluviitaleaceae bacterium]|nr:nucleotidyltransferase domain-containing protein [Defluviitaleaceae bacterium]